MNFYIETENGVAKNHPTFKQNLLDAFGLIPENWESFIRVERPTDFGVYQIAELVYAKVDGVWTDVWSIRDMTVEEKANKQQTTIDLFRQKEQAENWSAWSLNEDTCQMQPPIPRPEAIEDKDIRWCGAENNWKEVPTKPIDNNQYKFDFLAWSWVQVVN